MSSPLTAFTDAHAALVETVLSSPRRPAGTLTYPQPAGWLFSLANSPVLLPPSEWLPLVFDDREAGYETLEEAEQVVQAMMALYNHSVREESAGATALPPRCGLRPEPMDNVHPDAPLSQWAQGFLMGYDYLHALWDEVAQGELDEVVGGLLMVLTFFAFPTLAKSYHTESGSTLSLPDHAATILRIFSQAMGEYAQVGRALYQARRAAGADAPAPTGRARASNGRNEPCPCGSGKKFKKCCGLD